MRAMVSILLLLLVGQAAQTRRGGRVAAAAARRKCRSIWTPTCDLDPPPPTGSRPPPRCPSPPLLDPPAIAGVPPPDRTSQPSAPQIGCLKRWRCSVEWEDSRRQPETKHWCREAIVLICGGTRSLHTVPSSPTMPKPSRCLIVPSPYWSHPSMLPSLSPTPILMISSRIAGVFDNGKPSFASFHTHRQQDLMARGLWPDQALQAAWVEK